MVNSKRNKFKNAVKNIPKERFGDKDMLSPDLADRVGSLDDKAKITIRLDIRIIEEAKRESERLGVGYQKIINDRLLEFYSIEESQYLNKESLSDLRDLVKTMESRINRLEEVQKKKRA